MTDDSIKKEITTLFVSNVVLTTRLKKLMEEKDELKETVKMMEVF